MDTAASADRTNAFTFRRESETNTNLDHLPPEVEEWWVENVKSMYDLESSRDVFQAVLRLSLKRGLYQSTFETLKAGTKQLLAGENPESLQSRQTYALCRKGVYLKSLKEEFLFMLTEVNSDYTGIVPRLTQAASKDTIESWPVRMGYNLAITPAALLEKSFKMIPLSSVYNEWEIRYDDTFARSHYSNTRVHRLPESSVRCCNCCEQVVLMQSPDEVDVAGTVTLADLVISGENCAICSIILRAFIDNEKDGNIEFFRTSTGLRDVDGLRRLLRFSADPDMPDYAGHKKLHMPIGLPLVPSRDRADRFDLLRAYAHQCDSFHECNKKSGEAIFPTRVLDVGGLEDLAFAPGWIRLTPAAERRSNTFVALSHCWGNLTTKQKLFCTTQSNIAQRSQAFHVSELPKTFKDAVKVVRALGLRYLWIDSLCIIQSGDNGEDWNREATKMRDVFSQAYCVIAATAASNAHDGFLEKHAEQRTERICVADNAGKRFWVSTDLDDFDQDVGKASLNTRAWVIQESVLARRTVHFTANQMYWECGKGVCCENLVRLKSRLGGNYFTSDPEFPARLFASFSTARILRCLFTIFEDYSNRKISFTKDRPIAISGLESSIAETLQCESRYCTLHMFIHRNLLWSPSKEARGIARDETVPTWSWLSILGPVEFDVDKIASRGRGMNVHVTFSKNRPNALSANLGAFLDCTLGLENGDCVFRNAHGVNIGYIWFDVDVGEKMNLNNIHCVVLFRSLRSCEDGLRGAPEKEYYDFMAVVPSGGEDEYMRVGRGGIFAECVIKVQENVYIV